MTLAPEAVEAIAVRLAALQTDRPPAALNLTAAAAYIGVSLDFLHEHVLAELRVVRRGRRRIVPVAELDRWLEANAERAIEGPR